MSGCTRKCPDIFRTFRTFAGRTTESTSHPPSSHPASPTDSFDVVSEPQPPHPPIVVSEDTRAERLSEMQLQLDSLREQLTESQRLATIGTIAAVIAHEFNNLLTPIV